MRKKILKIALIVIAAAAVCFAAPFAIVSWVNSGTDTDYNTVLSEEYSPSGEYKLVIFERDIDATTAISYQLSIISADDELDNESGNIYVADLPFEAEWESDTAVTVYSNAAAEVYKAKEKYKSIEINYSNDTSIVGH